MTVLAVSPHLDDAILSAGQFLAGYDGVVHVLTVFAGNPPDPGAPTPYDRKCGFASAGDAIAERRAEDRLACSVLGAQSIHLDVPDSQYASPDETRIVSLIAERVQDTGPDLVLGPVGIHHPDHQLVARACVSAFAPQAVVWLYEELPYRIIWPELVPGALQALSDLSGRSASLEGLSLGPMIDKAAAVVRYRSQLGEIDLPAVLMPERYWRLVRADD